LGSHLKDVLRSIVISIKSHIKSCPSLHFVKGHSKSPLGSHLEDVLRSIVISIHIKSTE